MTNNEVITVYEGLQKLEKKDLNWPIVTGYTIAKNKKILEDEVKIIYDLRNKILLKYGSYNDSSDIIVPKEKVEAANNEIQELLQMENGLILLEIPVNLFKDMTLTLEDLNTLQYMIKLDAGE